MIRSDKNKTRHTPDGAARATILTDAQRIAAAVARDDARVAAAAAKKALAAEDPKAAQIPKTAEDPKAARYNGFDPYNSGSFDRKQAWSKVGKR